MATTNSLPPRKVFGGRFITNANAAARITSYIADSTKYAHLHPDCIFSDGAIVPSSSLKTGGITLHHLRRVEAGLQGKQLGTDGSLDGYEDDEDLPEENDARA